MSEIHYNCTVSPTWRAHVSILKNSRMINYYPKWMRRLFIHFLINSPVTHNHTQTCAPQTPPKKGGKKERSEQLYCHKELYQSVILNYWCISRCPLNPLFSIKQTHISFTLFSSPINTKSLPKKPSYVVSL